LNQKYFQIGVSSELSENLYDLNRGGRGEDEEEGRVREVDMLGGWV
jgi:hypothetical protein